MGRRRDVYLIFQSAAALGHVSAQVTGLILEYYGMR